VFGATGLADKGLPLDLLEPYDTSQAANEASSVFVEGIEGVAFDLGKLVAADPALLKRLATCTPAGPDDRTCMRSLIASLGRRLWRRPLDAPVIDGLLATAAGFAGEGKSFAAGARFVVQALVQSPGFIYRAEIGAADPKNPNLRRLDNFEIAARLSFLVTGAAPDPGLLDEAAGLPFSTDKLAALATARLDGPRASEQMTAFHRMWVGYGNLRVPAALVTPMLQETEALIRKVLVTDKRPWSEIFTSPQTFASPALATHYGLGGPAGATAPTWINYTHPERLGILSHGSFLSLGARDMEDTSPTTRGKFIATRLLCRTIPPPPPDVNSDVPPKAGPDACKSEAYAAHRKSGAVCLGCHQLMDPVGFGLERFDALGRYRMVENGKPSCPISGDGELAGIGAFNGIKSLVMRMMESGELAACGVKQFLHYATGRLPAREDEVAVKRLQAGFLQSNQDFRRLIIGLVTDPVFIYRVAM
jgi:hypothetical protein